MIISTPHGSIDVPNVNSRPPMPEDTLGIAMETLRTMPLNGLRYPLADGASGWYIWGGETMQQTADFFSPIRVRDLGDYVPNIAPFLSLPPGFRFLTDNKGRQKVWFDGSLLDV